MSRDENPAVVEPRKGKHEEGLPSSAILIFTPQDLQLFLDSFPERPKRSHEVFLTQVFSGSYHGHPIALAGPMLGAPQAVLVLEKLVALGVRSIVAVGWCGSLRSDLRIGDVLAPISAVSEEGTSRHYPISISPAGPSMDLLDPIRRSLEQNLLKLHMGKIWSTDAPYRETVSKVLNYQREDVLAVDMESSALFTVALFRKVRLAMILIVSDELFTLKWVPGFKNTKFLETRKKLAQLLLDCFVRESG
jgi:uridine phosphorylase